MTTCMDAKVPKELIFLRYLQEHHLLRSFRIHSMYFRQKDTHFQLDKFGLLMHILHERIEGSGHFFTPLAFAPSIGKFLYLFHLLPSTTCSTFVKFMHKMSCLFSMPILFIHIVRLCFNFFPLVNCC